jgi:hypothetical protein
LVRRFDRLGIRHEWAGSAGLGQRTCAFCAPVRIATLIQINALDGEGAQNAGIFTG